MFRWLRRLFTHWGNMRLGLRLGWQFKHGYTMYTQTACMGGIWSIPEEVLREVKYIVYSPLNTLWDGYSCMKYPNDVEREYLMGLLNVGFTDIAINDATYKVDPVKMNLMKWFSTITVMRYLYERNDWVVDIVNLWRKYPDKDKWLLFAMYHLRSDNPGGHQLFPPYFVKVKHPKEVFKEIEEPTGFDLTRKTFLHGMWCISRYGFFADPSPAASKFKPLPLLNDSNLQSTYDTLLEGYNAPEVSPA